MFSFQADFSVFLPPNLSDVRQKLVLKNPGTQPTNPLVNTHFVEIESACLPWVDLSHFPHSGARARRLNAAQVFLVLEYWW
jgi:hypothetical protein